jgi:hypothetical protein
MKIKERTGKAGIIKKYTMRKVVLQIHNIICKDTTSSFVTAGSLSLRWLQLRTFR